MSDNHKKGQSGNQDGKTQKIDNQHIDEAVELESEGSEIKSEEEEEEDHHQNAQEVEKQKQKPNPKSQPLYQKNNNLDKDVDDQQQGQKGAVIPGTYNPADYSRLEVSSEIKELFKYITKYTPEVKELDSKLKPFIPEFYPAVGEVDAYIKMPRPDGKDEQLGLNILDEPSLNQSNRAVLILKYKDLIKKTSEDKTTPIDSIRNAEKNPKEIQLWINSVGEIRKTKQPHSVSYSNKMPEIDDLMQVWPQEIEDAIQNIKFPSEEIDLSLEDYCKLACSIIDIPVHATPTSTNIIESLHVLFTLYSEFKANQHFQQNKNDGQQYDQMQLQLN